MDQGKTFLCEMEEIKIENSIEINIRIRRAHNLSIDRRDRQLDSNQFDQLQPHEHH